MIENIGRRELLRQIGAGVVGGTVVPALLRAGDNPASTQPATQSAVGTIRDLPTRRFGRIGLQLPVLSFGTAAMGHAFYEPDAFEEVVSAALAEGLTVRQLDYRPRYRAWATLPWAISRGAWGSAGPRPPPSSEGSPSSGTLRGSGRKRTEGSIASS